MAGGLNPEICIVAHVASESALALVLLRSALVMATHSSFSSSSSSFSGRNMAAAISGEGSRAPHQEGGRPRTRAADLVGRDEWLAPQAQSQAAEEKLNHGVPPEMHIDLRDARVTAEHLPLSVKALCLTITHALVKDGLESLPQEVEAVALQFLQWTEWNVTLALTYYAAFGTQALQLVREPYRSQDAHHFFLHAKGAPVRCTWCKCAAADSIKGQFIAWSTTSTTVWLRVCWERDAVDAAVQVAMVTCKDCFEAYRKLVLVEAGCASFASFASARRPRAADILHQVGDHSTALTHTQCSAALSMKTWFKFLVSEGGVSYVAQAFTPDAVERHLVGRQKRTGRKRGASAVAQETLDGTLSHPKAKAVTASAAYTKAKAAASPAAFLKAKAATPAAFAKAEAQAQAVDLAVEAVDLAVEAVDLAVVCDTNKLGGAGAATAMALRSDVEADVEAESLVSNEPVCGDAEAGYVLGAQVYSETSVRSAKTAETSVLSAETSGLSAETSGLSAETSVLSAETSVLSAETSVLSAETSVLSAETSGLSAETSVLSAETSHLARALCKFVEAKGRFYQSVDTNYGIPVRMLAVEMHLLKHGYDRKPYPDPMPAFQRNMVFKKMWLSSKLATDHRTIYCGSIYGYAHPHGTPANRLEHFRQCRVLVRSANGAGQDTCGVVDLVTGIHARLPTDRMFFLRKFEDSTPDEQASAIRYFGSIYRQCPVNRLYFNPAFKRVVPLCRAPDCGGHAMMRVLVLDDPVCTYLDLVPARLLVRTLQTLQEVLDLPALLARVKTPFHLYR